MIFASVILALAAWRLAQFLRGRRDFPTFLVTITIVIIAASQALPNLIGTDGFVAVLGVEGYRIYDALLVGLSLLTTTLFFQSSARADTLTRRRVLLEVGLFLASVIATITVVLADPAQVGPGGPTGATRAHFAPGVAREVIGFYLASNLYYVWALATAVLAAVRSVRLARGAMRLGLAVATLGMLTLLAGTGGRLATGCLIAAGLDSAYVAIAPFSISIAAGIIIFVLGVALPALWTRVGAGIVWLRRRQAFRELGNLWSISHGLFPDLTFRIIPGYSVLERAGLRHVARNHCRRVIEIHDGLMQLSRYLTPDEATDTDTPVGQARLVDQAIHRHHAGRAPSDYAVDLGVARHADTLDQDAHALVALSRALHRLQPGLGRTPATP